MSNPQHCRAWHTIIMQAAMAIQQAGMQLMPGTLAQYQAGWGQGQGWPPAAGHHTQEPQNPQQPQPHQQQPQLWQQMASQVQPLELAHQQPQPREQAPPVNAEVRAQLQQHQQWLALQQQQQQQPQQQAALPQQQQQPQQPQQHLDIDWMHDAVLRLTGQQAAAQGGQFHVAQQPTLEQHGQQQHLGGLGQQAAQLQQLWAELPRPDNGGLGPGFGPQLPHDGGAAGTPTVSVWRA